MSGLRERMEEASVRIDQLIWIPAATTGGVMSSALKDAIDDLYDDDRNEVVIKIPKLKEVFVSGDVDEDWVVDILQSSDGFLAQLARPVPTSFHGDVSSHSYSWGYYRTKWVYVADMEELASIAEAFSEEVIARSYAKHLAKLAAATGVQA